ncbi:MAG: DeoR family transcriptional regulator [bacterium]|nr:DeoR family transcriptional regulator [bacterium]MDA1024412.1 DeoR family transcriptional regulator [bacterium]
MLNERQEYILSAIIEDYVSEAQPVSSKRLVEKYALHVSPATVRNDMVHLEELGFLRQPHTSAGRIPTEEGYRYYLDRFVRRKQKPRRMHVKLIAIAKREPNERERVHEIAKIVAKLSGESTFLSLDDGFHRRYGISNLLGKPEFDSVDLLREVSSIIDAFDDTIASVAPRIDQDVNVWIGGDNPFGPHLSTVLIKYTTAKRAHGILGLVGPIRMDYGRNIKLLSEAKQLLEQSYE